MRKAIEQKTIVLECRCDYDTSKIVFDSDAVINQMLRDGWEYHGTTVYITREGGYTPEKRLPCQVMVRFEGS